MPIVLLLVVYRVGLGWVTQLMGWVGSGRVTENGPTDNSDLRKKNYPRRIYACGGRVGSEAAVVATATKGVTNVSFS